MYKIITENLQNNNNQGVYFIRNKANNLLKIGRTQNLKTRFKNIESSFKFCGVEINLNIELFIECDFSLKLEKYLHEKYNNKRKIGEWFDIKNINIKQIDKYIKECEDNITKINLETYKNQKKKNILYQCKYANKN